MRFFITALFAAAPIVLFMLSAEPSAANDLSAALTQKMKYLSQSQAVISKNLANANTPGYKTMEIKEPKYNGSSNNGVSLAITSPMHIAGASGSGRFKAVKQKNTYETAPNGNNVSIEEQMVRMSSNSLEHQSTTNLLHKIHKLVNLATGER